MKKTLLALLALASLGLGACAVHAHPVRPHGKATAVVIAKGHAHTKSCGHYRNGTRWYQLKGHVHGKRCGHARVKGIWVVKR